VKKNAIMAAANVSRIEPLGKDNFDTWKLQVQTILTKADLWEYASEATTRPVLSANNAADVAAWERNDQKARSDHHFEHQPEQTQAGQKLRHIARHVGKIGGNLPVQGSREKGNLTKKVDPPENG
jgi:hypothetical protein